MDKEFQKLISYAIFGFGIFVNFAGMLASIILGDNIITTSVTTSCFIINILFFILFVVIMQKYNWYNSYIMLSVGFILLPTIFYSSDLPYEAVLYNFILPPIYAISITKKRKLILPMINMMFISYLIVLKSNDILCAIIFFIVSSFLLSLISCFTIKLTNYTKKLEDINDKLSDAARKDLLTGLYNRYGILQKISLPKKVTVMMFDIDNFKLINDNYSHYEGDRILKDLSTIILRYSDKKFISCRWGGEEFLIISEYPYKRNLKIVKSIFEDIKEFLLTSDYKNVTISGGMSKSGVLKSIENDPLIKEADDNLYHSKNNGRAKFSYNKRIILKFD